MSFKYGEGEEDRSGRYFNFQTQENVKKLLNTFTINFQEFWTTEDLRPNKSEKWLNLILERL